MISFAVTDKQDDTACSQEKQGHNLAFAELVQSLKEREKQEHVPYPHCICREMMITKNKKKENI